MTIKHLIKILQKEGGKCILFDSHKENYLVIELKKCEIKPSNKTSGKKETEEIAKANRDIAEFKAGEEKEIEFPEVEEREEVKIEDLPF